MPRVLPWWLVLLLSTTTFLGAVAACGSFSGSDGQAGGGGQDDAAAPSKDGSSNDESSAISDAGTKAPLDGAAFSCATMPGAFYCADFDEMPPVAFTLGNPQALQGLPDGSAFVAPPLSPPFAFWSSVDNFRVNVQGNKVVTYIHAAFQIRFDSANVGKGSFAQLSVGPKQCYLNLKQERAPDRIGIDTHCDYGGDAGSFYDHQDLLQPLPAPGVWFPVELTLDLANATSYGRIGGTTVSMGLNPTARPGGVPTVEFGPDFVANRVGIDNIVVDVK